MVKAGNLAAISEYILTHKLFHRHIRQRKIKSTMPTPTCSKCKHVIPAEDVNVANDVAYCRQCNIAYALSKLTHGAELNESIDLNNPPAGTWFVRNGMDTVIGGTNRSLGTATGLLAIGLFWNGIVSIFISLALSATLHNLHISLPAWLPIPKMNGGNMNGGMTIFLWLFLTPFIVIGLSMIGAFLSAIAGKTRNAYSK